MKYLNLTSYEHIYIPDLDSNVVLFDPSLSKQIEDLFKTRQRGGYIPNIEKTRIANDLIDTLREFFKAEFFQRPEEEDSITEKRARNHLSQGLEVSFLRELAICLIIKPPMSMISTLEKFFVEWGIEVIYYD